MTGPAGAGKSYALKQLEEELLRRGEKVHVCAYTHAAARLVGGATIAHLLKLDARLHDAWIIVDEMSLIPVDTLGQLARIQLVRGAKFVHSVIKMANSSPWPTGGDRATITSLPKARCSATCAPAFIFT